MQDDKESILVSRGRVLAIKVIFTWLITHFTTIYMAYKSVETDKLDPFTPTFMYIVLLVFFYQGHAWARNIMAFFSTLAFLYGLKIMVERNLFFSILLPVTLVWMIVSGVLIFSKNLKYFQATQREKITDPI